MSSLSHHGIKGQRWGVRRFQNKDGTRTALGKKQLKAKRLSRNEKGIRDVYRSLSDEDFRTLGYSKEEADQERKDDFLELGRRHTDYDQYNRVRYKDGKAVGYIAATGYQTTVGRGKKIVNILAVDLAVHSEYRGNGYSVALGKDLVRWFDTYGSKEYDRMEWYAMSENIGSQKAAERSGFTRRSSKEAAKGWVKYRYDKKRKLKHTSIGGTMYIEGNALILGDSSYLEHHGILGQKWGVRRFQNKDGTLTREGQIRFARKNLKHAKVRNLDKWGKSPDSNVLYIIGTSGSGKSTTAKGLADDGDQVIHLDTIFEKENRGSPDSNKDFEEFLKTNNVDISKTSDFSIPIEERWKTYDAIGDLVEAYGQHCFSKGSKVVIEGVQMGDQSLYPDKNYFNGKPTVVLKGNIVRDTFRADRRDGVPLRKTVVRLTDKERWNWYKQVNATSNEIKYTSIGGTMYIEGNALILGDSSYLEHHGILGQKWGVRRFQNKDGTRTAAGKKREAENLKSSQEAKNVNSKIHSYINKQLSSEDLDTGKSNYDFASNLIKDPDFEKVIMPVVQDIRQTKAKYGNKEPYESTGDEHQAYMNDIDRLDKKTGELAIAIGLAEKGEPHKKSTPPEGEYERVDMFRYALARYLDEHSPDGYSDEGDWIYHSSMEGTFFIEDGTLYLSHHGIRGQRWGVRRFQNRDGSLTNAGRKRLGYATKSAVQTVGKAFKAGVKAGGKAVKAAKAHHEKKEAEKLQKKKEKASKTRLGVMANKDLFTNEEIRKLNERFKLEDEMKMATLQKGVEIAKAVGTIAQNVGTMAKAYEDVTGQSLSPIKRKAAEEKAKQDAEDRKRKLAKEDAETKRAEDKEKRDIEDRERRIKLEDEDRVRKQAKEDADAQRAENAEKRAQAKEQRDSSMAVELQRKAKAAADEQEHKAVKAKAESRSAILDVLEKIDKIQDHDDDDHNNPPGGGIDTWNDDDYLNFFKKTGIIHSDVSDGFLIQNGVLFVDSSDGLAHHGIKGQRWGVRRFQNADGSLTDKGRKHYEKAIEKLDRKQVNSDNRRGRLERQHPFAVTASAILTGSAYAALMVASAANPAMVVAGSAIAAAVSALGTHVDYSIAEAWEGRGTKRRQKKRKEYEEMLNHDGLIISDGTLYLEHHGIKGQRWGVRRFQNPDGTRTEAGKKHDAKLAVKAERKQAKADMKAAKAAAKAKAKDVKLTEKAENLRKREIKRYEKMAVKQPRYKEAYEIMGKHAKESDRSELLRINSTANARSVIQGIGAAMILGAFTPTPVAVAGGIAIAKALKMTNVDYVRTVNTNARLNREARERKLKEAQSIKLEHSSAYGMPIQNGTLFINADEPYLEHHGVLGMKWGKHLRAGKGPADAPASAGGGGGEDDEKLKEMAKKAGMSVAEYKQKFASKIGGAASKVGEKVYDAAGGSHKKNAEGWRKMAQEESNAARASERSSHENSARAASQDRKYGSGGDVYRRAADSDKENAKTHHSNAKARSERAASEQAAYEKSLAGKYDKMKADRARKKSAKEKKRFLTQGSAEAKKVSVKDKHLVINRSGSSTNAGTRSGYQILPEDFSGAARPKAERKKITRKDVGEALYNIAGGNAKKAAQEHHRNMVNYKNEADKYSKDANTEGSAAKAHKRAGNVSAYIGAKTGARVDEENAKNYRLAQYSEAEEANKAQKRYDRSLAGLYDKATGKYKQVHKQTKTPSLSKQYQYYMKDVNGKLFDHGKPKTAKERAKAEVWNAADYRIKAQDYYNQSFDPTNTAYGYDAAYRKAAVDQGRLAEGAYRRAAALGKQASSESSTSSRPRARKKKHTSGGSGVTVRRPGRKPVSRTKRVTQSSTGVKRRGSTGSGRTVRRGA